jgi:hypothetical protein
VDDHNHNLSCQEAIDPETGFKSGALDPMLSGQGLVKKKA